MEQNKESTYIVNLSLTTMPRTNNGERFGKITVLGKLDSYQYMLNAMNVEWIKDEKID